MAKDPKEQAIIPIPPTPTADDRTSSAAATTTPTGWKAALDRVLSVQRPAAVAHVRATRRRHPDATPAQIITILERQYLAAVSTGGAAVGASAVIPGVGFATALGLSGVETLGFLETSALFAQSITEVHGIALDDPERASTLVMAMMLGAPGTALVKQLASEAAGGQARSAFWGEMVTASLPRQIVGGIGAQLRDTFVKRFAARQGASVIGRAIPFGIGAVVGGVGNHALGRRVIQTSRTAFGPPPADFPYVLEPKAPSRLNPRALASGSRAIVEKTSRALPRLRRKDDEDR